jgi:hypothetical protein
MIRPEINLNHAPRIPKQFLPLLAGIVWSIAGSAVLSIGLPSMVGHWKTPWVCLLAAAAIFFLFFRFIFFRLFRKHMGRIDQFPKDHVCAFAFFDVKGYIIMACMITFGILLRSSGLLPPIILGVLYTGIGFAMIGAVIAFLSTFFRRLPRRRP